MPTPLAIQALLMLGGIKKVADAGKIQREKATQTALAQISGLPGVPKLVDQDPKTGQLKDTKDALGDAEKILQSQLEVPLGIDLTGGNLPVNQQGQPATPVQAPQPQQQGEQPGGLVQFFNSIGLGGVLPGVPNLELERLQQRRFRVESDPRKIPKGISYSRRLPDGSTYTVTGQGSFEAELYEDLRKQIQRRRWDLLLNPQSELAKVMVEYSKALATGDMEAAKIHQRNIDKLTGSESKIGILRDDLRRAIEDGDIDKAEDIKKELMALSHEADIRMGNIDPNVIADMASEYLAALKDRGIGEFGGELTVHTGPDGLPEMTFKVDPKEVAQYKLDMAGKFAAYFAYQQGMSLPEIIAATVWAQPLDEKGQPALRMSDEAIKWVYDTIWTESMNKHKQAHMLGLQKYTNRGPRPTREGVDNETVDRAVIRTVFEEQGWPSPTSKWFPMIPQLDTDISPELVDQIIKVAHQLPSPDPKEVEKLQQLYADPNMHYMARPQRVAEEEEIARIREDMKFMPPEVAAGFGLREGLHRNIEIASDTGTIQGHNRGIVAEESGGLPLDNEIPGNLATLTADKPGLPFWMSEKEKALARDLDEFGREIEVLAYHADKAFVFGPYERLYRGPGAAVERGLQSTELGVEQELFKRQVKTLLTALAKVKGRDAANIAIQEAERWEAALGQINFVVPDSRDLALRVLADMREAFRYKSVVFYRQLTGTSAATIRERASQPPIPGSTRARMIEEGRAEPAQPARPERSIEDIERDIDYVEKWIKSKEEQ